MAGLRWIKVAKGSKGVEPLPCRLNTAFAYKLWFLLQSRQNLPHWRRQVYSYGARLGCTFLLSAQYSPQLPVPYNVFQGTCHRVIISCKAVSVRATFDSTLRSNYIAVPYSSARQRVIISCKAVSVRATFDSTLRSNYIAVLHSSARQRVIISCKHQIISSKGRLSRFELPSAQWCVAIILQHRTPAPAEVWSSVARAMILRYHTTATAEVRSSVAR
ncbi:hypothetical protein DFH29DRAFT_884191 [Suillus ampliporus]|nr:hypothetical protein DFH29DRAFT_884191 [Suillus ampliporus]